MVGVAALLVAKAPTKAAKVLKVMAFGPLLTPMLLWAFPLKRSLPVIVTSALTPTSTDLPEGNLTTYGPSASIPIWALSFLMAIAQLM